MDSHGSLLWSPRFKFKTVHIRRFMDKITLEQVYFMGTLVFPANHSPNVLYLPSFLLRASTINSVEAEVQGHLVLPNSSHIIKFLT
jgi:hypothetical protein